MFDSYKHAGFSTLAPAFFGVGDLPKRYELIDIEYFEEAVDAAVAHAPDDIDGEKIAAQGFSKGMESLVLWTF